MVAPSIEERFDSMSTEELADLVRKHGTLRSGAEWTCRDESGQADVYTEVWRIWGTDVPVRLTVPDGTAEEQGEDPEGWDWLSFGADIWSGDLAGIAESIPSDHRACVTLSGIRTDGMGAAFELEVPVRDPGGKPITPRERGEAIAVYDALHGTDWTELCGGRSVRTLWYTSDCGHEVPKRVESPEDLPPLTPFSSAPGGILRWPAPSEMPDPELAGIVIRAAEAADVKCPEGMKAAVWMDPGDPEVRAAKDRRGCVSVCRTRGGGYCIRDRLTGYRSDVPGPEQAEEEAFRILTRAIPDREVDLITKEDADSIREECYEVPVGVCMYANRAVMYSIYGANVLIAHSSSGSMKVWNRGRYAGICTDPCDIAEMLDYTGYDTEWVTDEMSRILEPDGAVCFLFDRVLWFGKGRRGGRLFADRGSVCVLSMDNGTDIRVPGGVAPACGAVDTVLDGPSGPAPDPRVMDAVEELERAISDLGMHDFAVIPGRMDGDVRMLYAVSRFECATIQVLPGGRWISYGVTGASADGTAKDTAWLVCGLD